jgi:hypothetical protein
MTPGPTAITVAIVTCVRFSSAGRTMTLLLRMRLCRPRRSLPFNLLLSSRLHPRLALCATARNRRRWPRSAECRPDTPCERCRRQRPR